MSPFLAGAAALIPSAGVAFLFFLAIRALINADRTERAALARLDAEERTALAVSRDQSARNVQEVPQQPSQQPGQDPRPTA